MIEGLHYLPCEIIETFALEVFDAFHSCWALRVVIRSVQASTAALRTLTVPANRFINSEVDIASAEVAFVIHVFNVRGSLICFPYYHYIKRYFTN